MIRSAVLAALALTMLAALARADDVPALVRDFDSWTMLTDPVRAAQSGDVAARRRWPDDSPSALADRRRSLEAFRARAHELARRTATDDDALNLELITGRVAFALEGLTFDEERMQFASGDGFYTVPDYAALNTILTDDSAAADWIARLSALPDYYDREIANMRRGISTGWTQPEATVQRAIADLRDQLALAPDKAPLLAPFASLPPAIAPEKRAALLAQGRAVFDAKVRPAQRTALRFLESEYLPHARAQLGISSVPNGRAYYDYLVRRFTTTSLTPEAVHELGKREVLRIRTRMDAVIAGTGFKGTFPEFLAQLRSEPRFYVAAPTYGEKASEVAKRADFALPRWFRTLPRLTYGVRAIPAGLESSASGYLPGSPAQGVAGMVVYKPWLAEKMPTFGIAAWVLHEGVPGHHLQIALAQELPGLPEFRRADDVTAFVEGWALYSEALGEEMGIYRDPYELFGRLSLEIWRACRLMMDTGLHAFGWTRERAAACLKDNSALAPAEIEFEVERYIAWPAQALAYKIGEQKILELRARATAALGPRFDVRAFHDLVLDAGALPLSVLERRVDRWITGQRSASTARSSHQR